MRFKLFFCLLCSLFLSSCIGSLLTSSLDSSFKYTPNIPTKEEVLIEKNVQSEKDKKLEDEFLSFLSTKNYIPVSKIKPSDITSLKLNDFEVNKFKILLNKLEYLNSLKLETTDLNSIPKEIFNIKSITNLEISSKNESPLPEEIGKLTNLVNLDLRDIKINKLPGQMANLKNLKVFTVNLVENNKYGYSIYSESLETLNIYNNSNSIPNISEINNLKNLNIIQDTFYSDLSLANVHSFDKVETLKISFKKMSKLYLSEHMPGVQALVELEIQNAEIDELPNILLIPSLKKIKFDNLNIKSRAIDFSRSSSSLESLVISNTNLITIDGVILSSEKLSNIELINNKYLKFEDNYISYSKNLKTLKIIGSNLTKIPSLKENPQLEYIDFSKNLLEDFPIEIKNLNNLVSLNLSDNNIKSIPSEIENLKNLNSLYLGTNAIKEIPSSLYKIFRLNYIDLSNNRIEYISPDIINLNRLSELNLSNNNIKTLPLKINDLKIETSLILCPSEENIKRPITSLNISDICKNDYNY